MSGYKHVFLLFVCLTLHPISHVSDLPAIPALRVLVKHCRLAMAACPSCQPIMFAVMEGDTARISFFPPVFCPCTISPVPPPRQLDDFRPHPCHKARTNQQRRLTDAVHGLWTTSNKGWKKAFRKRKNTRGPVLVVVWVQLNTILEAGTSWWYYENVS